MSGLNSARPKLVEGYGPFKSLKPINLRGGTSTFREFSKRRETESVADHQAANPFGS
jgi:hypothetical protein